VNSTAEDPAATAGDATGQEAAAATPAAPEALTVPPAAVTVDVLNGTGTTGLAATVADLLRGQGFAVGTVGNEPGTVNESVVRYGAGVLQQARTVAAAVPGSVLQPSDSIGNAVQLVIGPGYSTVVPVEIGGPPADGTLPDTAAAPSTPVPAPVTCG
jgi:hypothetical protein